MTRNVDVAIVGGGIMGTAAAAFLAEAGLSVTLFERDQIASAASGRNSGAIQHPFDAHLARLHHASLALYAELEEVSDFRLPSAAGLLLLSDDEEAVSLTASDIQEQAPELRPTVLDPRALQRLEPHLSHDLRACRLETGHPVAPAAATLAFARRAKRAGAILRTGSGAARLIRDGERIAGVRLASGQRVTAGQVLVTAGPWSTDVIPGWHTHRPIRPVWGVVVDALLAEPPVHVLEELGINRPGGPAEEMFSLVTAGSVMSVGSTFLDRRPALGPRTQQILERAARFLPGLIRAEAREVRVCARPVAFDGRPLIGAVGSLSNLFVCAGHGAWGISTAPASARMVADQMLNGSAPEAVFDPARPM